MTPPSGLRGTSRSATAIETAEGRREPELEELERHGRGEPGDQLVGRHDHDESRGRGGNRLLSRMCRAAALDQPSRRVHLVRAVDGDVELRDGVDSRERLHRQAERPRRLLRRRRGGDAAQRQRPFREGREQMRDRRAGAESHAHAVLDERGGRLGRKPLLVISAHA